MKQFAFRLHHDGVPHVLSAEICVGLVTHSAAPGKPVPIMESRVTTQASSCSVIGEQPRTPEPGYLVPITLDALARTLAVAVAEASDYHQALDQFRGYFEAALLREG